MIERNGQDPKIEVEFYDEEPEIEIEINLGEEGEDDEGREELSGFGENLAEKLNDSILQSIATDLIWSLMRTLRRVRIGLRPTPTGWNFLALRLRSARSRGPPLV